MKSFFTFFVLFFCFSALAQERLILNSSKLATNAQEVIFVRTAHSPKSVKVTFHVPMAHKVCERYEYRPVLITSGPKCGYEYRTERVPTGRQICQQKDPRTGHCTRMRPEYRMDQVQVPRSCYIQESYCVRYGTEYRTKADNMSITFKNLPALGGSEIETFRVTANQNGYDSTGVGYTVSPLKTLLPYKVKKKKTFLGIGNEDDFVVSPK